MKKFLLTLPLALLISTAAQSAEIKPYVSAAVSINRMQNDAFQDVDDRGDYSLIVNESLSDGTLGFRAAFGFSAKIDAIKGGLRMEAEYATNAQAEMTGQYIHNISGWQIPTDFTLKVSAQAVFANLYYDFNTGTKYTPYIGGGAGYSYIRLKGDITNTAASVQSSDSMDRFAWNLGGGVGYEISNNVTFDIAYRYTNYGKKEEFVNMAGFTSNSNYKFDSHEVKMGLRYTF